MTILKIYKPLSKVKHFGLKKYIQQNLRPLFFFQSSFVLHISGKKKRVSTVSISNCKSPLHSRREKLLSW